MKKNLLLYILMIVLITSLAVLMNLQQWDDFFSFIKFSKNLHIIIDGTNSLVMFLIFLVSNHLYGKTKDGRFAIIAGGFLIGSIFNCVHIVTLKEFPYDLLSITNISNNPTMVYLLFTNLILPLSIYFALIYKSLPPKTHDFRFKIYTSYLYIFLVLCALPFLSHCFLPVLIPQFQIIIHSLEFINYSLYIMLAFILVNIRHSSKVTFSPLFTFGLVILGLGGLFYISPSLIQLNEILAHVFQLIGLVFLLAGITRFQTLATFLRFKDALVAYLCLVLISFYVVFISITSALFHIIFPQFSAYVFIEFILIFQFIIYALSVLSWNEISCIFDLAEREHSIRNILETMRRVSNQNIIKNSVINEISKVLNTDRCFIVLYDASSNSFYFDTYAEFLPSRTLMEVSDENEEDLELQQFCELFENNIEICFTNVEEYVTKNSLKGSPKEKFLKEHKIKSFCSIPIKYESKLYGYVILQYIKDYKKLNEEELVYLNTMTKQVGIAIQQSKST